jgi:hypothetical protein
MHDFFLIKKRYLSQRRRDGDDNEAIRHDGVMTTRQKENERAIMFLTKITTRENNIEVKRK